MAILTEPVAAYLADLRPPRTRVMAEMEQLAERDGVPIVQWETGRMLAALAGSLDARVLEVGTAIGYSALHMAEALDKGTSPPSSATRRGSRRPPISWSAPA